MKRVWAILLLSAGFSVCACAATVSIKGSNTFGEELGPRLIREFERENPGISVTIESRGTATGFAALLAGEADIAAASRVATEDELRLAQSRRIRLNSYLIGYYGVAVIVHRDNPVRNLTDAQVAALFTGAVTNWAGVGGNDQPVQCYIRDPVSGTYLGFQELAMNRQPYVASAKAFRSYAEIARAVAADPGAVGYVGLNLASHPGVRAVTINGRVASVLAVNEGMYPYARALRLYTNRDRESAATRAFVRFVLSRRGQQIVEEMGNAPRYSRSQFSPTTPW